MNASVQDRSHYFRRAMDAIEAFNSAQDALALTKALLEAGRSFGYEHFLYATAVAPERQTLDQRKLMMSWPDAWRDEYERNAYVDDDVVVSTMRKSRASFCWRDLPVQTKAQRRIFEIAAVDHGMENGFCVPIHRLEGYEAGLSLAGKDVDDSVHANFALELIAVYAFNRFSRINPKGGEKLTRRQREMLKWVALGKTSLEIGTILSVSNDTVAKTIANAMKRLDVHTRAQAVAAAMRSGDLSL